MDVKTAFLSGILKEEIYMEVPEEIKSKASQVCKLKKSLYDLKQATRCWFEIFDDTLTKMRFKRSEIIFRYTYFKRQRLCKFKSKYIY